MDHVSLRVPRSIYRPMHRSRYRSLLDRHSTNKRPTCRSTVDRESTAGLPIQITHRNSMKSYPYITDMDHVYLRHLSTEYRSILSADLSTDSRPICGPRLGRHIGRHQPTRMSADTRPILHRHLADTSSPTIGQHYAHLVSSCYGGLYSLLNC